MSIRSMTGYARVRKILDGSGEVTVSVKTVNHRGLDTHFHLSADLDPLENSLRSRVKSKIARGHVQIHVFLVRNQAGTAPEVNMALLNTYLTAFREAARVHNLSGEPDLNAILRISGIITECPPEEMNGSVEEKVLETLDEALQLLNEFREREGVQLADEIRTLNRAVSERVAKMEEIRARALPAFHARLSERLAELLKNTPTLEPQRLVQEAAVLADRSDVSEELTRLRIHSLQVDELLHAGAETGKKLDFLLQEMNREANTTLSKSTGIGDAGRPITDLALAVKADIEKMREQALNLE